MKSMSKGKTADASKTVSPFVVNSISTQFPNSGHFREPTHLDMVIYTVPLRTKQT